MFRVNVKNLLMCMGFLGSMVIDITEDVYFRDTFTECPSCKHLVVLYKKK